MRVRTHIQSRWLSTPPPTMRCLLMAVLFLIGSVAWAQPGGPAKGTVISSSDDLPIPGVNVVVKGTTNGTITDMDGNYSLNVEPGSTLVFSFIGFESQELVYTGQPLNVTLVEESSDLDEVVVVGYGVQKKKLVTGATVQVKGDDIQKLNTTQALGALQSQTPGVTIQAASGQPGDTYKVMIRGAGTNSSTTPLYVIDGVSGGDINNLNPADIESIDVLKDAASCAIYGSAAANGVILITTKQGKEGKIQVTYDGYLGWQNVYKMPDLLTAKEYMNVQDLVSFNSDGTTYDWSKYFQGYEDLLSAYQDGSNEGTNWLEELRKENAVTTSHAVSITGGNDKSHFSIGIGYQYQDGVFGGDYAKSDYRRLTVRLNSDHVIWTNKKGLDVVKIGENMYFSHKQSQGIQIGNQYSNEISNMLRGIPLIPVYAEDGDFFGYDEMSAMGMFNFTSYATNPIAAVTYSQSANNKSVSFNMNLSGWIEVQPIKNLVYKGQINYSQSSWSWRCYLPTYKLNDQGAQRTSDQATNQVGLGWSWGTNNTLDYKFTLADSHHIDIMVGTEYGESRPDNGFSLSATASSAVVGDLKHAYMDLMQNNTSATVSGSPYDDTRGMSFFARLNYDFKEKYMLSAVFRADGSSVFSEGNRWGYFPSVSAGWVVTSEDFMDSTSSWLSYFKIRAGWGQNGNNNIDPFQYEAAYAYDAYSNYSFGNTVDSYTSGASLSRLANEDLTWETSEQIDIGFDSRFLDSRLGLTFDWYQKETKDLLLDVPVNSASGFDTQLRNAGTVRNRGVEVALTWNDGIGTDFKYNVGVNFAYNKNEVTKVNSSQKYNSGGSDLLAQSTGYMARFEEGHPIGYFWGYKTAGVIQNAKDLENYTNKLQDCDPINSLQGDDLQVGDLMFVDVNGDGVINTDDKTELGDPNPDYTLGINIGASWKGIDLNITGYAALGQEVARSYRKFTDGEYENYTSEVYDYWWGEGTSNKYPRLCKMNTGVNWQSISDIYIEDADYFRLQNLTIGYDFKYFLLKNAPLQQVRIYFSALNLFTITDYKGMDPENGLALDSDEPWVTGVDVGNYPQPRTYLIGVNVKF